MHGSTMLFFSLLEPIFPKVNDKHRSFSLSYLYRVEAGVLEKALTVGVTSRELGNSTGSISPSNQFCNRHFKVSIVNIVGKY